VVGVSFFNRKKRGRVWEGYRRVTKWRVIDSARRYGGVAGGNEASFQG